MRKKITIGSRGSRLAEIQAKSVLSSLADIYPGVEFSLSKITTIGDKQKAVPIDRIPSYGAFVKELEEALLDGRIDLAVHSLKDLPVPMREGLQLAAVSERVDPRDVLVSQGKKLKDLASNSIIGTGSPRRTTQLLNYRSDLIVKQIRGNIDTRLRKVSIGEVDGVVVAAAGLIRLGWQDRITEYLPIEHFLPPAGQGILAMEIRAEDEEMLALLQPMNHKPTWQITVAERTFLEVIGSGCSTTIACLGTIEDKTLRLQAMATSRGKLIFALKEGATQAPKEIANQLAQELLQKVKSGETR